MKLQLLLLAACLCAASAGIPKKLLKKYAMKKVMESCYGEQLMSEVKQEVKAACDKCHGQQGPELPQLRSQVSAIFGVDETVQPSTYRQAVQYVPVPAAVQFQPISYHYQRRWKRSSHHEITVEKLEKIRIKMASIIGNMTCVLKEMKMLDSNNQVDFASIKERVTSMPLTKEHKDDLYDGMDECRSFASCLPSSIFEKSPVMAGFGKQMAFFKCFQMVKIKSCMKKDFREEYFPMLLRDGLAMDEEESFQTIITNAMLEESDMF